MCCNPSIALDLGYDDEGKRIIKFKRPHIGESLRDFYKRYGKDRVLLLDCGKCPECILKKRKEWSLRCACEAKYHNSNCFVTLTYDNDSYDFRSINQDHLDFIKALRNDGHQFRYYGCYEVGPVTGRSHYHICLFGYKPEDLDFLKNSKTGKPMFESKYLTEKWAKGFVNVQEFTPATAGYVAGYVDKKFNNNKEGFTFMSTHPGLGFQYCVDNADQIVKYGQLVGDFGNYHQANIPRYFKKVLEKLGYDLSSLSEDRKDKAENSMYILARDISASHVDEIFKHKFDIASSKLDKLVRCF